MATQKFIDEIEDYVGGNVENIPEDQKFIEGESAGDYSFVPSLGYNPHSVGASVVATSIEIPDFVLPF